MPCSQFALSRGPRSGKGHRYRVWYPPGRNVKRSADSEHVADAGQSTLGPNSAVAQNPGQPVQQVDDAFGAVDDEVGSLGDPGHLRRRAADQQPRHTGLTTGLDGVERGEVPDVVTGEKHRARLPLIDQPTQGAALVEAGWAQFQHATARVRLET